MPHSTYNTITSNIVFIWHVFVMQHSAMDFVEDSCSSEFSDVIPLMGILFKLHYICRWCITWAYFHTISYV